MTIDISFNSNSDKCIAYTTENELRPEAASFERVL